MTPFLIHMYTCIPWRLGVLAPWRLMPWQTTRKQPEEAND